MIADIPGLISGAAQGKGLGHKFLKHITRTKMLLHLVSLDQESPEDAYYTILKELADYNKSLTEKTAWIILTKKDLVDQAKIDATLKNIDSDEKRVFVVSENDPESIKILSDALVSHLREG